jgi:hypothetical protein
MQRETGAARTKRLYFAAVAISFVVALGALMVGVRRLPIPTLWKGVPRFEATRAFNLTKELSKGFPNRVPWRPERKGAASFIKKHLASLGYEPRTIEFGEVIGGRQLEGLEDIYAVLPGTELKDEFVVVLAHYDVTDTTVEGAADDGSGVGTVLELARIFKQGPAPKRNIVFLLTDSEEFGAFWGAHKFVERFPDVGRIVAAISLDFVAPGEQRDIMVLVDGLKTGYAPLWLRELTLGAIRSVPYPADDMKNAVEFVQRAILIPPSDHGAFLAAGVPSVNLFGRSSDFAYEMGTVHHTPEDNMGNLRVESFAPYGKATEIALRSIDALPPLLASSDLRESSYWKISDDYYITGTASRLIQICLFFPFVVFVVNRFSSLRRRPRHQLARILKNEAKNFALLFASFLAGYAFIRKLPDLKIITKYEMFPATQKSEILYRPEYLVLALVLAVITVLYVLLSRLLASRADRVIVNPIDRETRKSLLGAILGVVVLLAFAKNSYLGTLLLLPPAYLWMFMKANRRFDSRVLNGALFLGGLVSFIAVCIALSAIFHVGVFYWYLFLAVSYGLISVYAAILAFMVIAVGIRILRNLIL